MKDSSKKQQDDPISMIRIKAVRSFLYKMPKHRRQILSIASFLVLYILSIFMFMIESTGWLRGKVLFVVIFGTAIVVWCIGAILVLSFKHYSKNRHKANASVWVSFVYGVREYLKI